MRLTVHHETRYSYPHPVANSVNEAWLRPVTDERQACLSFRLLTAPVSEPRPYTDYFGNTVYHFDVHEPHGELRIVAEADVLTDPFDSAAALAADRSPVGPAQEDDRWLDFLTATPLTAPGERIRGLIETLRGNDETVGGVLRALADAVHSSLSYEAGRTGVQTAAVEALAGGAGVCQDYTHVFISAARLLGVPARYVSGYLYDGGGSGEVQASHAWPEALLPATGWVGLDVTNGCLADERYVRVAIGRDYADVPPVRGAFSGAAGHGPSVKVCVEESHQQQQ